MKQPGKLWIFDRLPEVETSGFRKSRLQIPGISRFAGFCKPPERIEIQASRGFFRRISRTFRNEKIFGKMS